jgi:TIR domain
VQLFISHSSKDREWVELVRKQLEEQGFSAYLAEYDLQPGSHLAAKIQGAIAASDAVVVVLTENAAASPIVRDEIGHSLGLHKPVVPLVTPAVARNSAMLGMLNGLEYVPFDIDSPQDGLLLLTAWVHKFASAQQAAAYEAQLAQLQAQRDAALLLLVFVGAVAAVALLRAE